MSQIVSVGSEAVSALLSVLGMELPALAVQAIAATISLSSPAFCSGDPPADPHPTQTDVFNAIQFQNPVVSTPALLKLSQWFLSYYWYQICECVSVTTPQPPALTNPGPTIDNPGLPVSGPNACFDRSATFTTTSNNTANQVIDVTNQLLPTNGVPQTFNCNAGSLVSVPCTLWPIPPTATKVEFINQILQNQSSVVSNDFSAASVLFGTSGFSGGTSLEIATPGEPQRSVVTVVPNTNGPWIPGSTHWGVSLGVNFQFSGPHYTDSYSIEAIGTCNGPPLEPGCCPPDPLIDQKLTQIIGYLTYLINKPSGALTAYTKGAVHSGLTGSASIPVSNLAGVLVDVTANPPSRVLEGNPAYVYDLGWMSLLTGDGMIQEQRISRLQQMWFPQLMGLAVTFGYFLNPGVTATITELHAA